MTNSGLPWGRGLLVSVRDADEARAAAAGGAAIIDVKEPSRGPLGRADAAVAAAVAAAVPRLPMTLACAELADGAAAIAAHVRRIVGLLPVDVRRPLAVKAGPAGLGAGAWARGFRELVDALPAGTLPVAVAYADWRQAGAPAPETIVAGAAAAGAAALLVDTCVKKAGDLFAVAGGDLTRWMEAAAAAGLPVALAGRLDRPGVARALETGAAIVGVRSAVCHGGRSGRVDVSRVRSLATLFAGRDEALCSGSSTGEWQS